MVVGLEGKIDLIKRKQDVTNSGLYYLCQVAGGIKDGMNAKLFQDIEAKLGEQSKITYEDTSLKSLQFLTESSDSDVKDKPVLTKSSTKTSLQLRSKLLKGLGVMSDDVNFLSQLLRDSMELQAQTSIVPRNPVPDAMKPLQEEVVLKRCWLSCYWVLAVNMVIFLLQS